LNSARLYSILNDQSNLSAENLSELSKLTEQFPYFQTAHLLYSVASKKADASLFQQSIKKTAIIAVSRNHLYNLLYKTEVADVPVEKVTLEIVKPVAEVKEVVVEKPIEVVAEVVSEKKEPIIENVIEETETKIAEVEAKEKDLTEQVEREIQKDLIEAFVEKEILKTNEAHIKDEPVPANASFSDWLQHMKKNNGQPLGTIKFKEKKEEEKPVSKDLPEEDFEVKLKKEHKKVLIDKIIESNPGSIKLNKDTKFFEATQKAKESLQENEHLVTETLAKIYALQGNINKAIRAYQILSLKYPNKSVYFASQIENLKKAN
jgi:hypothetical protein